MFESPWQKAKSWTTWSHWTPPPPHTHQKEHAVHTLASRLLTSASSEVRAAFWLRAVERAASLLFSWLSKELALDTADARSFSFFLALEQQKRERKRQWQFQTVHWPCPFKAFSIIWSQTAQVTLKLRLLRNTFVWFLQAQPEPCPGLSAALLSLWQFHPKPVEHQPTLPHTKPSGLSPKEKDQPCNYLSEVWFYK